MKPKTMIADSKAPEFKRICAAAAEQMKSLQIPGISIGVLHKGKEHYAGLGVTSLENPLPITGDTLFQIASISKTFLATAVIRLADAGKIKLDIPVRKYLPGLKLKNKEAAGRVTMRHLLTHTGGWVGDYFNEFGGGDDALKEMVASMSALPQVSPLGRIWSYNNAGFYLAGRIIEVVTGKPFEAAMKELVFDPLGLKNTFYSAREVMTRSFAAGHHVIKNKNQVARPYGMSRATLPAGGIISSAKDLLRYGRFQMGDGSFSGKRIISRKGMKLLHAPQISTSADKNMALAWFVLPTVDSGAIWHGGSINGQKSDLLVIPARKFAMVIFSNNDNGGEACSEISKAALREYFGILPQPQKPLRLPKSGLREYLGKYEIPVLACELSADSKGLVLKMTDKGGFPTPSSPPLDQPPPARVAFYEKDRIMGIKSPYKPVRGEFLRGPGGKIEWLRIFHRAHKRVK